MSIRTSQIYRDGSQPASYLRAKSIGGDKSRCYFKQLISAKRITAPRYANDDEYVLR